MQLYIVNRGSGVSGMKAQEESWALVGESGLRVIRRGVHAVSTFYRSSAEALGIAQR